MSKLFYSGLLFVITIGFGILLSKLGKPYNNIVFTIHKLIALGTSVFTFTIIYEYLKKIEDKNIIIILGIILLLLIISLFVSGALLSVGNMPYATLKLVHNITAILIAITAIIIIFILYKNNTI